MSDIDGATLIARSLKQQGINHLFGVVGFPVTAVAVAAQKEGVAFLGMRNEQSAALRGRGLRLSHRPPRSLPHRHRSRRGAWSGGPCPRPAELLADDPDRRRLGDLSRRHGCVPGRAAGLDRLAILQVRARHRERPAHPLLCRDGTQRPMVAPAPPIYLPDDIIRGKCDLDQVVEVERVGEPPRMAAPIENVEAALNLLQRAERPLVLLGQGHGVVARGRTRCANFSSARKSRSCARRWARA